MLPPKLAHRVVRTKNILFTLGFYKFCRGAPTAPAGAARADHATAAGDEDGRPSTSRRVQPLGPAAVRRPRRRPVPGHPDGDAEVVTDHIDSFVPEGIRLKSGRVLEADVVVTATGLRCKPSAASRRRVDGEPVDLPEQFVWQGAMLTGVPNFAICVGYTNASWTLRADLTPGGLHGAARPGAPRSTSPTSRCPDGELEERPLLDLTSGYIQRATTSPPAG